MNHVLNHTLKCTAFQLQKKKNRADNNDECDNNMRVLTTTYCPHTDHVI